MAMKPYKPYKGDKASTINPDPFEDLAPPAPPATFVDTQLTEPLAEPLAEPAPAEAVRPLERGDQEGVPAVGVREPAQPATALPTWVVPETPKAEPAKPVDVPREPQPAVSLNQPAVVLTLAQVARAATSLGVQPAELLRKLAATGAISDAELARLLPPLEG